MLGAPHGLVSSDGVAVAASVYEQLGMVLTPQAAGAMAAHVAATPTGRHGAHRYRFEDLGLSQAEVRSRFERYMDRFEILVTEDG